MLRTWKTRAVAAAGAVLVTATGAQGIAQAVSGPADVITPAAATATSVDSTLAKNLQFTREEERMARDLYAALAAKYDDAMPFSRITRSEQRHFDAVGSLLTRYGVSDVSAGKAAGTYAYPELQQLYDDWLAQGSKSLEAAHDVGVALEKRDIADLKALEATTTDEAAKTLFRNLREGSEQHLAAFEGWATGEVRGNGTGNGPGNGPGNGTGNGTSNGPGNGTGNGAGRMGPGGGMGPGDGSGDCPFVDDDA